MKSEGSKKLQLGLGLGLELILALGAKVRIPVRVISREWMLFCRDYYPHGVSLYLIKWMFSLILVNRLSAVGGGISTFGAL